MRRRPVLRGAMVAGAGYAAGRSRAEAQARESEQEQRTIGPVQLLVVAFEDPDFRGRVLEELARLKEADVVRNIDALVVQKDEAGEVTTARFSDLSLDEAQEFGAIIGTLLGLGVDEDAMRLGALAGAEAGADGHLLSDDDVVDVVGEIPNDTAAAIALLEHRWAIPFRQAILEAGDIPVVDTWVHPLDIVALGLADAGALGSAR